MLCFSYISTTWNTLTIFVYAHPNRFFHVDNQLFHSNCWKGPPFHIICISSVRRNSTYTLFNWLNEFIPAPILHLVARALIRFLTSAPPPPGVSSLFLALYRYFPLTQGSFMGKNCRSCLLFPFLWECSLF